MPVLTGIMLLILSCQTMDIVIDKLQNNGCNNLEIVRVNTDTYAKAAVKYKVSNVPTLLLCNQGQVL